MLLKEAQKAINMEIYRISMQLEISPRAEVFTDRALKDNCSMGTCHSGE